MRIVIWAVGALIVTLVVVASALAQRVLVTPVADVESRVGSSNTRALQASTVTAAPSAPSAATATPASTPGGGPSATPTRVTSTPAGEPSAAPGPSPVAPPVPTAEPAFAIQLARYSEVARRAFLAAPEYSGDGNLSALEEAVLRKIDRVSGATSPLVARLSAMSQAQCGAYFAALSEYDAVAQSFETIHANFQRTFERYGITDLRQKTDVVNTTHLTWGESAGVFPVSILTYGADAAEAFFNEGWLVDGRRVRGAQMEDPDRVLPYFFKRAYSASQGRSVRASNGDPGFSAALRIAETLRDPRFKHVDVTDPRYNDQNIERAYESGYVASFPSSVVLRSMMRSLGIPSEVEGMWAFDNGTHGRLSLYGMDEMIDPDTLYSFPYGGNLVAPVPVEGLFRTRAQLMDISSDPKRYQSYYQGLLK